MYLTSILGLFLAATCVVAQSGTCSHGDPQICVVNGQTYGCYNGEVCVTGCNTQDDGIIGQITYCVRISKYSLHLMTSPLTGVVLNSNMDKFRDSTAMVRKAIHENKQIS